MNADEKTRRTAVRVAQEVVARRSMARLKTPNALGSAAHHAALDCLERIAADHPDGPYVAALTDVVRAAPYVTGSLTRGMFLDWLDGESSAEATKR